MSSAKLGRWDAAGFRHRLRRARMDKGISAFTLGARMGRFDGGEVSRWENGHSMPTLYSVATVAFELGVSVDWLIWGDFGREKRDGRVA